jgi:hypothetical protein
MDEEVKVKRQPGRPRGYKLSESTKEKIRAKRLGVKHSKETKDKISKSLINYFKNKDSLADSIEYEYSTISKEAVKWLVANKDDIDETEYVLTDRRLWFLQKLELCVGKDVELFGHDTTPEFILCLKEELQEAGRSGDIEEMYSLI